MEEKPIETSEIARNSDALHSPEKQGSKPKNSSKIATIICAILAVVGIAFGVYEYLQVNKAKQQIADLKVEIKNSDGSTTTLETDKIEVKEDTETVVVTTPVALSEKVRLLSDDLSFSTQRYRLLVSNDDPHNANNDDKYYTLDMNSLGTANAVKAFDLQAIMQPLEDNEIANLPETSKNAIGGTTNKNECDSFIPHYHDPELTMSLDIDLTKEIPIKVTYICHEDTGDGHWIEVAFYKIYYYVDVEAKTARRIEGSGTNDFSI